MKSALLAIIIFFIPFFATTQWINEIHYDNNGADVNECIEIAGPAGTDMSGWSIVLYNGPTPYDTDALSGIIPDEGCGYGVISLCYPANGIQNGGADGIVLYDGSSVIQFLSYEGVINATSGVANGMTSTDIGVTEGGSTVGSSLQLTGSGTTYSDFAWQGEGPAASIGSLNTGQSISSCGPITNTITIDAVSSLTFGVDCTTGDNGTVDITTTDVFTAGNIYSVELSDASGSFASPITIGTLASTSNSATINFTIPSGTATGAGYRIRVVSSAPSVTSADNGSDITITLTGSPCVLEPPHMTSVIINSCNPTCNEGFNEIVFGSSGGYSIDVTVSNFNFEYGSVPSPGANTNYTDVLVNNATRINELDAAAGCPGLFIDALGTTIPPNASWMMAYTDICEEALDWSGLCGSGPIYVIFQDDPNWNTNGNFVNSNSGIRYLNTTITTTSTDVFDIDYNFDSDTYSNSDGVFVQYNSSGGSPTLYGDDDCMLEPVVLPIELYSFSGELIERESYLYWTTLSEYNFSHFEIFHATDETTFYKIGTVNAAGNTDMRQDYRMIHPNPVPGVNYYRLAAIDIDGTARNHGIIALNLDIHFAFFNGNAIVLDSPYAVEIYNLQGQLIQESSNQVLIPFNDKGVFFIREMNSGTTQKIVIQ